jgi:hypothetical protein
MTYIVRPFIAPLKSGPTFSFAASGAIQLLVGRRPPAAAGDEREVLGAGDVGGWLRWR